MAVSILFLVVSGSSISVRGVLLRLAFDENPSAANFSHLRGMAAPLLVPACPA